MNFFSEKSNKFETTVLVKITIVISEDQIIANIFIEYFDIIVPKLGLAVEIPTKVLKENMDIFSIFSP